MNSAAMLHGKIHSIMKKRPGQSLLTTNQHGSQMISFKRQFSKSEWDFFLQKRGWKVFHFSVWSIVSLNLLTSL